MKRGFVIGLLFLIGAATVAVAALTTSDATRTTPRSRGGVTYIVLENAGMRASKIVTYVVLEKRQP